MHLGPPGCFNSQAQKASGLAKQPVRGVVQRVFLEAALNGLRTNLAHPADQSLLIFDPELDLDLATGFGRHKISIRKRSRQRKLALQCSSGLRPEAFAVCTNENPHL